MSNSNKKKPTDDAPHPAETVRAPVLSAPPTPGLMSADAGNMDKIRDILFGNQARDYEKRFIRMEQQLSQDAAELKEELLRRIDTLENYIKQEFSDINDRIKRESGDRSSGEKRLQADMEESFGTLNKKLILEEENLAKKSAELRAKILEQSKQLSTDLQNKFDLVSQNLKRAAEELDDAKVNRSDLSGFFLETAMRLSGDDAMGGLLKE